MGSAVRLTGSRPSPRRVRKASAAAAEINVTPLVDVVLVLLIIFMVVTPLAEKDIAVQAPTTEAAAAATPELTRQIIVSLGKEGTVRINGEFVSASGYIERLRAELREREVRERVVFGVADDLASYAKLVGLMDGAKQAGAEMLALADK